MSLQKARAAIGFISPHDRDTWVTVAMAVKNEFLDDAFDLWDQWSQGAESYNAKSAKAVWKSISAAGKIGIGTLFHLAAANGWRDNGEHRGPLTEQELADKRRVQAVREAATHAEEQRKQRGYAKAAKHSQTLIDACALEKHYYLNAKGFPGMLALVADGVLVVPMRDFETNALRGAQTIEWMPETQTYEKKMIHGMRAKGAVLCLGDRRARETFLVEGYATGISVDLALRRLRLNASTLICFSDSNLAHIASEIKTRAFVFADNDVSGAGERAAKKTGFPYCMSGEIGEDANDLHHRAGLTAVCKKIIEVRMKAK